MTPTEKQIDKYLLKVFREEPLDMITAMLVLMAKEALNMNAETMHLSQESTIEDKRYKILCKIRIKQKKL